jgi:hypothetical protein
MMMKRKAERGTDSIVLQRLLLLVAGLSVLWLSACGIMAPKSSDGFADLESLGMRDTNRVVNLSIGPTLLHFAAMYVDEEPEIRELLQSLDGVRVRVYEIDGDAGRVASRVHDMSQHLQADGWEPVLLVREENEETHMLLRTINGRITGMTVLTSDGESEAVIVNLMGEIRPEQFGEVMLALDVDAPGVETVRLAEHEES